MANFLDFKVAISNQFDRMQKHSMFRMEVSKDALWDTYLKSFPEGTNPIFKERTEHDCQCCKSFIRAVGNVVAIVDKKLESIWDVKVEGEYQVVGEKLQKLLAVRAQRSDQQLASMTDEELAAEQARLLALM